MPNITRYLGTSPNDFEWTPPSATGLDFEELVYSALAKHYSHLRDQVTIKKTQASGDYGKDIIISSTVDLTLFGLPISRLGRKRITIYIECKQTVNDRLPLEKFGKNFLQVREDEVQYFVLATNGTITPVSYYFASSTFANHGVIVPFVARTKY